MALPFFRKGKDKPPSPAQQPAEAAADDAPITETLLTMDMGASGIVVEETSGAPQSQVDEAAILYASGQADMAENMLKGVLATGDRRAWHMLFDLYCIQNREKEFEQLALDYAVRFETSPPVWQRTNGNGAAKPQQAQTTSLELPGLLDKKATATLRDGLAEVDKKSTVRIDFSRIEMVDETGASECAQILSAARKAKRKITSQRGRSPDRIAAGSQPRHPQPCRALAAVAGALSNAGATGTFRGSGSGLRGTL